MRRWLLLLPVLLLLSPAAAWAGTGPDDVVAALRSDPVYVDDMYRFFKANAASIAYEAYQNNNTSQTDGHQLCPTTPFPRAQGKYAQDWRAG